MKRLLVLALSALLTVSAFAGNDNGPVFGGGDANQSQNQGQVQGQAQGQLQGQAQFTSVDVSNRISNDVRTNATAFAGASSGASAGSSNSLTINEAAAPNHFKIRNTPDVAMGNVYPTAPCMGSSNIGGSGPGFSLGVGTSWRDDECGIRETARSFRTMGLDVDALAVLCTSQYSAAAPSCAKK